MQRRKETVQLLSVQALEEAWKMTCKCEKINKIPFILNCTQSGVIVDQWRVSQCYIGVQQLEILICCYSLTFQIGMH